jgi:peptidoglycan/xylan/chitin deacetylase (PgdA/CDA1 family)
MDTRAGSRRILLGGLAAALLLGIFVVLAVRASAPAEPRAAAAWPGLGLVVRTPQNLGRSSDIGPLVNRLAANRVKRVWVQVKQDETDEFVAGTAFYPSRIAPVAKGFRDGRLGKFVDALAGRGIEPLAWMPVLHDERAARRNPEWRSRSIAEDGSVRVQEGWLCPFNPEVARHQAAIAREVVARHPALAGLYLDFIRYDDDYSCACPKCLAELEARTDWRTRTGRALRPLDVRRAGRAQDWLWQAWVDLRAEKIVDTVNTIRDAVEEVRPGFYIGAFVLPFSSSDYEVNTQAGQNLETMARAGLDEIVLMGYWDDWGRSPAWVRDSVAAAKRLTRAEAALGLVIDGDMGVRRTRLTLEALGPKLARRATWFNYGAWSDAEFRRLNRAIDGYRTEGAMPKPDYVSVVIRIDTEPDYQLSYAAVRPWMVDTLVDLFAEERVPASFITVGKLAERQTAAIRRAAAAGHEIGSHAYDHEQLDALAVDDQLRAVDRGLSTLAALGLDVRGFGAPRNSITDEARDRLMDWNLEYDGSVAYDPMRSLVDVHYAAHSTGADKRIVVLPFIEPNDWDARFVARMSARKTLEAWTTRLDRVLESGEPVFVLDLHQWSASRPADRAALRDFIRYAKRCGRCRIETLRDAARHARRVLDRYEIPAITSGER